MASDSKSFSGAPKIAAQLEKQLLGLLGGPTDKAAFVARYSGGVGHPRRQPDEVSSLTFLGHQIPAVRSILKVEHDFLPADPRDQWQVWRALWKRSSYFELKLMVLLWISQARHRGLRCELKEDLLALAGDVDNWPHSDTLSTLYAELLEADRKLLKVYKTWNRSSNPWLRRQSVVGLYCYARWRKDPLPAAQALAFVEPLLGDSHFYVQRGVGWTLREIDRVDPKLQRGFVKERVGLISPTAWFAATELYPEALRKRLVVQRKSLRQSGV